RRLTSRNANPYEGEPYYNLGLALRYLGHEEEAYAAFYKAVWNQAWQSPAYLALAELDAKRGNWTHALEHLHACLRVNADHLNARNLLVLVLRKLGKRTEAEGILQETRALDPMDVWACHLEKGALPANNQMLLDLALDYSRSGLFAEAIAVLSRADK